MKSGKPPSVDSVDIFIAATHAPSIGIQMQNIYIHSQFARDSPRKILKDTMKGKKRWILIILIGLATFYYLVTTTMHNTGTLYFNAKVYTLDSAHTIAEAVALHSGRISATGTSEELRERFPSDTMIDLHGATVVPGLIDGHAHMYGLGELMQSVILVGIGSPGEAALKVKDRVSETPKGQWIYGRGWDQNLWKVREFPVASVIDTVAPEHPVVLIRIDGHAIWVNSLAMRIAGITKETKDPSGGRIVRLKDGTPTGVFIDNARDLVENCVPPPTSGEIERSLLHAAREYVKAGVTEVCDMGIDSNEIEIYRKLFDEQKLPLRIYAAVGAPGASWEYWKSNPPLINYAEGMFTLRSMKMYVDGALGSRGAALVDEYSDDPGNRGLTINDNELEPQLRAAIAHGYQPCVHAIGDRGNHFVLDTYAKILAPDSTADIRPRIEHAQVLLPDDIDRFKRLNVLPSMQPIHATSDMPWAEARLGPQRIRGAYPWRSILNTGSIIIAGSDAPNDGLSPLWGFYAAITRQDRDGNPAGGWYPDQCMTRDEALKAYTIWAAYGCFQENEKGTIEPGKRADLTVLSKDIMTIPPREILSTSIVMTIIGGKIAFDGRVPPPAN